MAHEDQYYNKVILQGYKGDSVGSVSSAIQGSRTDYYIQILDRRGHPLDITSATLSGAFSDTTASYNITGTLTPESGQEINGKFIWSPSVADVGMSTPDDLRNGYRLVFNAEIGGLDNYTFPVFWNVLQNPATTAVSPQAARNAFTLLTNAATIAEFAAPIDNTWRSLDCSSAVPANATAIVGIVTIGANGFFSGESAQIGLRSDATQTNPIELYGDGFQAAVVQSWGDVTIPVVGQTFEWNGNSTPTSATNISLIFKPTGYYI